MTNIKEVAVTPPISGWKGSERTAALVKSQIKERWGSKEAESYDPFLNALTYAKWQSIGFQVKKNEKALRSMTLIEKKDGKGNIVRKYPKTVFLFYHLQVEKISPKS